MARPTVSILMPSYQHAHYLPQAIESCQAQLMPNWELLVGDDASTDGTEDVILRYAEQDGRIGYFRENINRGQYHITNRLLDIAQGEFAVWMNSDDALAPKHLEEMLALAERHAADCVLCDVKTLELDGTVTTHPGFRPKKWQPQLMAVCQYYPILGMLIRTEVWRKLGGFDESFKRSGDWNLLVSLALGDYRVHWTTKPLAYYRTWHKDANRVRLGKEFPEARKEEEERIRARFAAGQHSNADLEPTRVSTGSH